MCIGLFAGCDDGMITDRLSVVIRTEYKDEFLAGDFSAEDFEWSNVDQIEYGSWHSSVEPESGYITIYLKEHGRKHVKSAKKNFEKLDFVREVHISYDGTQTIQ